MAFRRLTAVLASLALVWGLGLGVAGANPSDRAVEYLRDHPAGPLHIVVAQVAGFKPKGNAVTDMGILVRETQGHFDSVTRHSQVLLAEIASGNNPASVDGVDLVRTLLDANLEEEGVAGQVWALLALQSAPLELPEDTAHTKEEITRQILSAQVEEGFLTYPYGEGPDLITTALAVCAVQGQEGAQDFVQRATAWLKSEQNSDGTFSEYDPTAGTASSTFKSGRATAAATLALRITGEAVSSQEEALLRFQTTGGGFSQQLGGEADAQTTELAVLALCGQKNPFDLSSFYLVDEKPGVLQTIAVFSAKSIGILAIIYIVLLLVRRYGDKKYAQSQPKEPAGSRTGKESTEDSSSPTDDAAVE